MMPLCHEVSARGSMLYKSFGQTRSHQLTCMQLVSLPKQTDRHSWDQYRILVWCFGRPVTNQKFGHTNWPPEFWAGPEHPQKCWDPHVPQRSKLAAVHMHCDATRLVGIVDKSDSDNAWCCAQAEIPTNGFMIYLNKLTKYRTNCFRTRRELVAYGI